MHFVNLKINRCTKKLVSACKASLFETNNRAKFSCNFSRKLAKFTNTPMLLQNILQSQCNTGPWTPRQNLKLGIISLRRLLPQFLRSAAYIPFALEYCTSASLWFQTPACVMFLHYYTYIHKILYSGRILWIPLTTMTLNKRPVLQPFFNWNANYING